MNLIIGTAVHKPGAIIHVVRTERGQTLCSFLSIVPPARRKTGTADDVTCQGCLKYLPKKLLTGDYLKP